MVKKTINVQGQLVTIVSNELGDYISLTDMAKSFGSSKIVDNWLRNKNTIEFLGVWEGLYNPSFNSTEFEGIKNSAGTNRFIMSVKEWVNKTNAIGLIAKAGKYNSGTFAQKDIAFEFGSWLSPEFKLYLIKEFQRLKEEEARRTNLGWSLQRFLSKVNYRIHTDSIRDNIIPSLDVHPSKYSFIYASEAEILNVALFDMTSKEWREQNPEKALTGNMRDSASIEQLTVLSNLESLNATLIDDKLSQAERLKKLRMVAAKQMQSLLKTSALSTISAPNLFNNAVIELSKIENKSN